MVKVPQLPFRITDAGDESAMTQIDPKLPDAAVRFPATHSHRRSFAARSLQWQVHFLQKRLVAGIVPQVFHQWIPG